MAETGYLTEAHLQELLAKYPELLSGEQVDPESPRRWLLVLREAGIPDSQDGGNRWAVDHLFLDQDGVPTLVEVKRSSDGRIRREMIGQMLDYAANALVYWPHERVRQYFEQSCTRQKLEASAVLEAFLEGDETEEGFWRKVRDNLQAQRVRLVFVADEIPPELLRVVEFLNGQMERTEVLALEVRQFVGEGHRTLVPRVLGRTAEAQRAKGAARPKNKWDEESFFAELAKQGDDVSVQVARRILCWVRERWEVWWGEGVQLGSFVPMVYLDGKKNQLFSVQTHGMIEIYFYWYAYRPPFDQEDKRRDMLDRLNDIPGIDLPDDSIHRRPTMPLASLAPEQSFQAFCAIYDWYLAELQGGGEGR